MTSRTMVGFADLTGARFGSVTVTGMVSRHPIPRWACVCSRCGSRFEEAHQKLTSAGQFYKCRNGSCAAGQEREFRQAAIHGVPAEPTQEQRAVRAMAIDEGNVGLLRAGVRGVQ